jgi:hypothetical protein
MIKIAQTLEGAADDQGWDIPPVLGTIIGIDNGYLTKIFPMQPVEIDPEDVVGGLLHIADGMMRQTDRHRRLATEAGVLKSGDITAGVWFVNEAWGKDLDSGERMEMRICTLIDCGGRHYQVMRVRGSDPETDVAEPGDKDLVIDGNIPDALRRMLLALGSSMSEGEIDMVKVGMVGAGE